MMKSARNLFLVTLVSVIFAFFTPASAQAAPSVTITADPAFIAPGGTSKVSWTVSGAVSCTASDSHGWSSPWPPVSDFLWVTLTATTTYYLNCTDEAGQSTSKGVAVAVGPELYTFTVDDDTVTAGETLTFRWTSSGDGNVLCYITDSGSLPANGTWTTTATVSKQYSAGCYQYDASGLPTGQSAVKRINVTVEPAPAVCNNGKVETGEACDDPAGNGACPKACSSTCTRNSCGVSTPAPTIDQLSVDKPIIPYATTVNISWRVSNADYCFTTGDWSGGTLRDLQGTSSRYVSTNSTFTLECFNDTTGVSSGKKSVTVALDASSPPPTTLNPKITTFQVLEVSLSRYTVTWASENAARCDLRFYQNSGSPRETVLTTGSITKDLSAPISSIELRCTASSGAMDNKTYTVGGGTPTPPVTPPCTPNRSCASNTCIQYTCSDGCGGLVDGTKACSTPPSQGPPPTSQTSSSGGLVPCGRTADDPATPLPADESKPCTVCHIVVGANGVIQWGMNIMTIIAITVIFAMGVLYVVSAGNTGMMQTAKSGMLAALIGFAVMLLAWLIVNIVLTVLADTTSSNKPFKDLVSTPGIFNFSCDINSNVKTR